MASRKRSTRTTHGNAALSIDELEDDGPSSPDLSQCRHGVRDDNDCVDCRTEGCAGGGDCSCGSTHHDRRRPLDVFRYMK